MINLKFLFILTLCLSSLTALGKSGDYVENYGENGLFSDRVDIVDHLEGFMGNSFFCGKANRAEYNLIEENSPIINIKNDEHINTTKGFDEWSEEIIFGEATVRSQRLSSCQQTLYSELGRNFNEKFKIEEIAWTKFQEIVPFIEGKIIERQDAKEVVDNARAASNFREDRLSGTVDHMNKVRSEARAALNLVKADISSALSRIPVGNRYEMKSFLLELIENNTTISKNQFLLAYRRGLQRLAYQANASVDFFKGIEDGNTNNHWVNEDLKKSLVQTGLVENVVQAIGLKDSLAEGFMCRTKARYVQGPTNLLLAEIPLYFTGVYGLGRASLAAGVRVVRATSTLGKLTANAALWSARAATIGIEAYTYARIADEVRQICFPPEYIASMQQQSCSFESELSGVYQEASIAQCLTSAALGLAPVAVIGGLRVVRAVKTNPTIVVSGARGPKRSFYLAADESTTIGDSSRVRAVLDSSSPNLEQAAMLTNKQRVYAFEEISGTALSRAEAEKLLTAHRRGPGYGAYSQADLRYKAQIVKEILESQGKTQLEIRSITRSIMRKGILGKKATSFVKKVSDNKKIQKTLKKTRKTIKSKTPQKSVLKESILSDVPENMKIGFSKAIDDMEDIEKVADYFNDLQRDTFLRMYRSRKSNLTTMANKGELDKETMIKVLYARARANNVKIVTIKDDSGFLSRTDFNKKIGSGYIVDKAFSADSAHGIFTHFLQQDFSYNIIAKTSKVKHTDIVDFMGTPEGMRLWDRMFDGIGSGNIFSPEWFKPNFMRETLPIGRFEKQIKETFNLVLVA